MRKHLHIDLLSLSWLLILLSISNCLTPGLRCALCALPKTCFLVCLFVFCRFSPKNPVFCNFSPKTWFSYFPDTDSTFKILQQKNNHNWGGKSKFVHAPRASIPKCQLLQWWKICPQRPHFQYSHTKDPLIWGSVPERPPFVLMFCP